MSTYIYCKATEQGVHSFFLLTKDKEYFLFNQNYRKGVNSYFNKGVTLEEARDFSKSNRDSAIIRTMSKLPMYIKYVEKEYGIVILNHTRKQKGASIPKRRICA